MSSSVGPRVVLYVDDDHDAHFLLRRAFEKVNTPARLESVYDGLEALEYLAGDGKYSDREKYPLPHLLLLDLKMPHVSGFEFLQKIGDRPELRVCPIVVFSSSNQDVDRKRAAELGSADYAVKPANFQVLIEMVGEWKLRYLQLAEGRSSAKASAQEIEARIQPGISPSEQKRPPLPATPPEVYRLLVEQVTDYAIFTLSSDGVILSWNEGARQIKGYESSEIIGKGYSLFFPPSDIEEQKPAYELRVSAELGRFAEEGWRVRKDGSRFGQMS